MMNPNNVNVTSVEQSTPMFNSFQHEYRSYSLQNQHSRHNVNYASFPVLYNTSQVYQQFYPNCPSTPYPGKSSSFSYGFNSEMVGRFPEIGVGNSVVPSTPLGGISQATPIFRYDNLVAVKQSSESYSEQNVWPKMSSVIKPRLGNDAQYPEMPLNLSIPSKSPQTTLTEQSSTQDSNTSPAGSSDGFIKTLSCTICSISFPDQCSYRSHMATHNIFRNYKCPDCQLCFKSYRSLRAHLVVHNLNIKCEMCPYKTHKLFLLKKHMTFHEIQERDGGHLCPTCGKNFQYRSNKTRHMRNVCNPSKTNSTATRESASEK